ncbi:GEVED domain-containing protein [Spirosoma validum]|uniref:T9SS type A sorting domain-containing protein n=1 Tax=Spirosoma validum TaxID=2771355 RepID=A0A927B8D1_9BACT|nr:GEVED domain-containing protein [Spirosoma validum]MBD2757350.1 T9SS type A sorting domain-containing protein [Spirosoma validum]
MLNKFIFFLSTSTLTRSRSGKTDYNSLLSLVYLFVLCTGLRVNAQKLDFGDAPESYSTSIVNDGPRHTPLTKVYLGGSFGSFSDAETDGQPGNMADGDDLHDQNGNLVYNQSDEDGLVEGFPAVCLLKNTYVLQVSVYNASGADATVSAWIDLNKDGKFDPSERTQAVVPTNNNPIHYNGTIVTLTWAGLSGLTEGWTYARLRVANNPAEVEKPTGLSTSGEVEDYRVQLKDEYDFGDAPESYGTTKKASGPQHLINNNLMLLGSLDCSPEEDGQPSTLADADAGENSVSFIHRLTTAKTSYSVNVNVLNTSGENAMLSGWIDFNRNGVFDANERAQAVAAPDARNLVLSWSGLSGLTAGRTYARFRVACNASEVANPTGLANSGSVEDYALMIEPPQYDYGDAPDSYGTVVASNGARHIYNDVTTKLCLSNGAITNDIDAETNGQPSTQANGDNAVDPSGFGSPFLFNDETALLELPILTTSSTSCSAIVSVKNQTGAEATLSGWIDFNNNGTFDSNERAQASVLSNASGRVVQVKLYWNGLSDLTTGQTYMRFRVASNAAEVANPTGEASDGEVEDYTVTITATQIKPLPVGLVSFQGQWVENKGNWLSWVTAWEKNNDHFEIQRSRDAKSFETIGRIAGKGNSASNQNYEYIDEVGAQEALTYYRLKQVDLDGSTSYSRIVAVGHEIKQAISMIVYPNPTVDLLRVQVSAGNPLSRIRVFSISGAIVAEQQGATEQLDVRSLATGVYVVEVTTLSGEVLRQRFIKK